MPTLPADPLAESDRIHFMDSLRAFLMMLGVVLHSAQVFNPAREWAISSPEVSVFAGYLVNAITTFRMPAFFMVSGFFCVWSLNRYAPKLFLRLRLRQVMVPFVVTALTLNSIQTALIVSSSNNHSGGFQLASYLLEGEYVSHLWFLFNLMIYFSVAGLLAYWLRKPVARISSRINHGFDISPVWVVLAILPVLNIGILVLNQLGFPLYSNLLGIWNTQNIIGYAPYFLFGAILGSSQRNLLRYAQFSVPLCAIGLLFGILGSQTVSFDGGLIQKTLHVYCETLTVWCASALCFQLFYRFANTPSRLSRFVSEASYTVYLFHHGLVVAIGLFLIQFELPIFVQLVVLITSVLIITCAIHKYFIDRYQILTLLFNGKLAKV